MALNPSAAFAKDTRTGLSELQHRHFATIAEIIRRLHADGTMTRADAETVAEHFAAELPPTNAKFDARRFLAACQVRDIAF